MADVIVPVTRARIPESRLRTSLVVSSEEWGGAAELAAWIQGSGGVALPSHHVGLEISTSSPTTILDTSLVGASYGWWRGSAVAFEILIACHRENPTGSYDGSLTVTLGDGTSTYGVIDIQLVNGLPGGARRDRIWPFSLAARGGEIKLVATAIATIAGLYVDAIHVIEAPRSKLALDELDCAALPGSCGPNSPINDVPHLSVRGAADAFLCVDWRRMGYFHHGSRANPILISDTDGDYVDLFPFGLPMQSQIRAPGDTSSTEVLVCIEARWDDGQSDSTAAIKVSADVADEDGDEQSIESFSWATYVFRVAIATEDLDSVDGRRGSAWELLRIRALVDNDGIGSPELRIGTIGVFTANAMGEKGWSSANYLAQPTSVALAGSDAMTRIALVRIDSLPASQIICSKRSGTTGWQLYMTSAGRVSLIFGDGGALHSIISAVGSVVAGRTYAIAVSWDGSTIRLVIGQTSVTPVAVSGASLAPSANVATIGLDSSGALPATGLTILGVAASDSVALDGDALLEATALCSAVADVRAFPGCEHLYTARDGLHVDLVGEDHFDINGSGSTLERFVPRMG